MRDGRMHQTTVRFGPDLWEALEVECSRLGMSAAQYVREAALARLHYTAGRRGEAGLEDALVAVGAAVPAADRTELQLRQAGAVTEENREESHAVTAQSEHVRRRAADVRRRS